VHDPALLLLDEPTAGVDPQSRQAIFETLEGLKRRGKALLYTTHHMEEVERLADRVVIIDHGRVVAEGTLAELVRRLPATRQLWLDFEAPPDDATLAALRDLPVVRAVQHHQGRWQVSIDDLAGDAAQVLALLAARGHGLREFSSGRTSLEDVFLALTGRELRG
jgi:ABC-2 type transport system ATP-binding protein